ncbi:uncharacterized protein LOC123550242 [Mercenaria mercenaria]|uniref:uncharacterized protein LOC123550242 n=1 Tax=Mercenaria mercenaria TaxID=6596 RepID=UPI00234F924F|nr:uncharacterized protein LOC123550242 [Mercenaria mercenaria]
MSKSRRKGYLDETLPCSEDISVPPEVIDLQMEYARTDQGDVLQTDKTDSMPTDNKKERIRNRSERRNRFREQSNNSRNKSERSEKLVISSEHECLTYESFSTPRKSKHEHYKLSSTGASIKGTPVDKKIVKDENKNLSLSLPSKGIKSEFKRGSINTNDEKIKRPPRRKSEPTQEVVEKIEPGAAGDVVKVRSKSLLMNKPNLTKVGNNSSREKSENKHKPLLTSSLQSELSVESITSKKGSESLAAGRVDSTLKELSVSLVNDNKSKTGLSNKIVKRRNRENPDPVSVSLPSNSSDTPITTRSENETGQEPQTNSPTETKTAAFEFPSHRFSEERKLETGETHDDAMFASESYDSACSKCQMSGKSTPATSYCYNCGRYLCERCLNRHNRDKTKMNHNILHGSDIPGSFTIKQSKNERKTNERCIHHPNRNIKCFCIDHSCLCCTECKSGDHAACKMQHLEHLLINVADVRKLKHQTSEESKLKLNLLLQLHRTLKSNKERLVGENDSVIEEVKNKTSNMIEHIKKLENDFIVHVSKTFSEEQSALDKDIETCENNIKEVSEDIQYLSEPKVTKESTIKTIEKVKQIEMNNHTQRIENQLKNEAYKVKTHVFEADMDLYKRITEATSLGEFIVTSHMDKSSCMLEDEPLGEPVPKFVSELKSISGWTDGDFDAQTCFTAVELLEDDTILVSDKTNMKLKWFDSDLFSLIKSIKVHSEPWGITRLDANKYIVTLPDEQAYREVELVNGDMKLGRKVNVGIECTCVVQTENHLLFAGIDEDQPKFLLTDLNCTIKQHVFTEKLHLFKRPNHLLKSSYNPNVIFVSDVDTGVFAIDVEKRNIIFHYKDKSLRCPMGMTMIDNVNEKAHLYVCSQQTHSLHCISKEGQFLFSVPMDTNVDMRTPQCICHLSNLNEFLLTTSNSYSFVRFKLNKKENSSSTCERLT